jgi:hypothetical protein
MTTHRLLGVTRPDYSAGLMALPVLANAGLRIVEALGFAALIVPDKKPMAAWLQTRKAEMNGLLHHQQQLEAIAVAAPVIPSAYGSERLTPEQTLALLTLHARDIGTSLEAFGALRQFQIEMRWKPEAAMVHGRAQGWFNGIDPALAKTNRKAFGEAVQKVMEEARLALGLEARAMLETVASDIVSLPLADEAMVLNAAVVIDPAKEIWLDKAVETIDALMPDLAIRYQGPLPAVSFASIAVQSPQQGLINRAEVLLGRGLADGRDAIKSAYRDAMKSAHADVTGANANTDKAAALARAQALLLKAADAPRGARGVPLLLDIRREGEDGSLKWAA